MRITKFSIFGSLAGLSPGNECKILTKFRWRATRASMQTVLRAFHAYHRYTAVLMYDLLASSIKFTASSFSVIRLNASSMYRTGRSHGHLLQVLAYRFSPNIDFSPPAGCAFKSPGCTAVLVVATGTCTVQLYS